MLATSTSSISSPLAVGDALRLIPNKYFEKVGETRFVILVIDDGIVEESVAEPPIIFKVKSLAFNEEVAVFDP